MKSIVINPLNPDSMWGALNIATNELICEGITPEHVRENAEKSGENYIMIFLFPGDISYVY